MPPRTDDTSAASPPVALAVLVRYRNTGITISTAFRHIGHVSSLLRFNPSVRLDALRQRGKRQQHGDLHQSRAQRRILE